MKKAFTIQSNPCTKQTLDLSIQSTRTQHKLGHMVPYLLPWMGITGCNPLTQKLVSFETAQL